MSPTHTLKKFEVGDLVEYILEEGEDKPIVLLLLEAPNIEDNPVSPFIRHRWKVLNLSNGDIAVTYVNTDLFRKVN